MTANAMQINIIDHCPECNPRNHFAESTFTFAGKHDHEADEALYACNDCGALVWLESTEEATLV